MYNTISVYHKPNGRVLWITGLSGAGKSTVALAVQRKLFLRDITPLILDGDQVREAIDDPQWGYDRESRLRGSYRYARLAAMAAYQGLFVIVPTISLFHEVHAWNRDNIPGYYEVFLECDESIRRNRDPKALYQAHDAGEHINMSGLDQRVELPNKPDLTICNNLNETSIPAVANTILCNMLEDTCV